MNVTKPARYLLGVLAAIVGVSFPLFADHQPNYSLGTVDVSAAPPPVAPATASATTITAAQIAASGASTLAGVLRRTASVAVNSDGPAGSVVSPSIRGSTANQVLVLVDGVPMNNPLTGAVDLSLIPLGEVSHIRIIPGGAAAIYGPGAVGGVIDIATKRSAAAPLSVSVENGSYRPPRSSATPDYWPLLDSQIVSLSAATKLRGASVLARGAFDRAANGYSYRRSDGTWAQLANAGLVGTNGSLTVSAPLATGTLDFLGSAAYRSHGVPGSESFPTPNAHEIDTRAGGTVRFSTQRFLSNVLDLSLTAHGGYTSVSYRDPGSGIDSHHQLWTAGLDLNQTAYLGDSAKLGYGLSAAYHRVESSDVGVHSRIAAGAYFSPQLSFGRLSLQPAVRFDYSNEFAPGAFSFLVDAVYHVTPNLALSVGGSRSVRFPTFDDLYWPAAGGVAGNPGLTPETAWESDLGVSATRGRLSYRLSGFARYTRNLILWEPGSDGVWRPSNYGVALYPGVEQQLSVGLPFHFRLSVDYSFLYSFALSGGLTLQANRRLPMLPVHTAAAVVEQNVKPVSWSVSVKYESSRYLSTANTQALPPFFVVSGNVRWRLSPRWSSYLAIGNLSGEQYQIEAGYPMPPTEVRVGIEARM